MPALFAVGEKVIGNPAVATFAAFGSFALLLLVDFPGPVRDRLQALGLLALAGGVLVGLGTLASRTSWPAAVVMAAVAFVVLFSGVVSSVLATATPALLLAFILPVSLPGPPQKSPTGWLVGAWHRRPRSSRSHICGLRPLATRCEDLRPRPVGHSLRACVPTPTIC